MTVKMIVAVDRGNAIGWLDGRLPWQISADMKRFKELTMGSTIVMGNNTFKSLGLPLGLPGRQNVVLSNSMKPTSIGGMMNGDVPTYFRDRDGKGSLHTYVRAHQAALGFQPPDLWIIGGASVYQQAIEFDLVDEIYLTQVDVYSGADVVLPLNLSNEQQFVDEQLKSGVEWYLESKSPMHQTPNGIGFTFLTLKRRR